MIHRSSDQTFGPTADARLVFLPIQSALMVQAAMLRAWEPWLRFAVHMQEQLCVCQKEFFDPHQHLRHMNVCSKAADLKDHYGRRTGDVEVERI